MISISGILSREFVFSGQNQSLVACYLEIDGHGS